MINETNNQAFIVLTYQCDFVEITATEWKEVEAYHVTHASNLKHIEEMEARG